MPALRGLALVQPALALLIVYIYSLRGAGDTAFPVIITLIGMLLIRIPLAYLGGVVLGWGLVGTSGAITWFLFCGFVFRVAGQKRLKASALSNRKSKI